MFLFVSVFRRINFYALRKNVFFCGSILVFSFSFLAHAQMDGEEVIKARQAGLRDMGGAYKNMRDELRKSKPLLSLLQQSASQLEDLALQQKFWFPPGSGPHVDLETDAKADIWERPDEFAQAIENLLSEAATMVQVTKGSDLKPVRKQLTVLGKSCKACHDSFREEED